MLEVKGRYPWYRPQQNPAIANCKIAEKAILVLVKSGISRETVSRKNTHLADF